MWDFSINEAKATVEMARLIRQEPDKYPFDMETDSPSETDTDKRVRNSN